MRREICIPVLLAIVLVVSEGWTQGPPLRIEDTGGGWFYTEGQEAVRGIVPAEAKRRALTMARERAIEYAVGIEVQATQFVHRQTNAPDRYSFLSQQFSTGKIVEESDPEWSSYSIAGEDVPIQIVRVGLRVKVVEDDAQPDPGFGVQVHLNQDRFEPGDEVVLAITATKACYALVLCETANDSVVVLLPHSLRSSRYVAPGDTLWIPNRAEVLRGIRYRALAGHPAAIASERIRVIATKRPYEFLAGREETNGYTVLPTRQAAITELMRWLVKVPRSERAEASTTYEIVQSN